VYPAWGSFLWPLTCLRPFRSRYVLIIPSHPLALYVASPVPLQVRLRTAVPAASGPAAAQWPDWVHEIKHDGFRILARHDERGVRLFTRNGYNFTDRFPLIADAINSLPVRSCLIDGEAIVVGTTGLSVFDLIRHRQHDGAAILCAFDLIELDGKDLRRKALEERKHTLANVLYRERDGLVFNQHYDGDGAIIFKQACSRGCEGIVSKRLGSPYRSGRSEHWLKVKNPAAPAVKREAEEDWGR